MGSPSGSADSSGGGSGSSGGGSGGGAANEHVAAGAPDLAYSEVLRTPYWFYPIAIGVAAILAAEFHVGGLSLTDWIPFCTLIPLSAAIVWWMGRSKLEIRGGELHIHGAHLPLYYVTGTVGLDPRTLRLVVGREGDPAAFVQIRPWIGPGVQLWIDDEDDPTPYWIVSSRHPQRFIAAVNATI